MVPKSLRFGDNGPGAATEELSKSVLSNDVRHGMEGRPFEGCEKHVVVIDSRRTTSSLCGSTRLSSKPKHNILRLSVMLALFLCRFEVKDLPIYRLN